MTRLIQWEQQIGRRVRLRDLSVFFTVVEYGSMAKAGAKLGVSTPTVSEVIADLEHALGVRLLDRTPKGVAVTPYGKALLARGRAAFDELRQGIRDIEFVVDEPWIMTPLDALGVSFLVNAFKTRVLTLPELVITTFSIHLRNNLVGDGEFITALPDSVLRIYRKRHALKELPIELSIRPPV